MIDSHRCAGQPRDFVASDERAANGSNRAEFCHWFAIACDDERLAGGDRVYHLRIVITEITLWDCSNHVANCSIVCDSSLQRFTL